MEDLLHLATAAGGVLLAVLCAVYLLYNRILVFAAWALHAGFATGFAIAASALWVPDPYGELATRALEYSGIPARLREGDAFARRIEEMPERLYERVRYPFTSPAEPEPPRMPAPGPLERALLPGFEGFTRGVLRALGFALGLCAMAFALAWRGAVDLVLTDRALRRRLDALERYIAPTNRG